MNGNKKRSTEIKGKMVYAFFLWFTLSFLFSFARWCSPFLGITMLNCFSCRLGESRRDACAGAGGSLSLSFFFFLFSFSDNASRQ